MRYHADNIKSSTIQNLTGFTWFSSKKIKNLKMHML